MSKHFQVFHMELAEANEFVDALHRHHKPVTGHRFSIACLSGLTVVGVAIVGRLVSRGCDQRNVLEITRLCTDGTYNVCSFLYGAVARAGKALGYKLVQTYILESEPGTFLAAAGYSRVATTVGGSWNSGQRKGRRED